MFDTLFATWRTFRKLVASAEESLSYQAYSDFEDACDLVAEGGMLDEATEQAKQAMSAGDAGDFYADLVNFACECSLDAEADGKPALVNARVFGIHAVGVLGEIGALHGNQALVKAVRSSGFVEPEGIVLVVGGLRTGVAARLSPQTLWNFAQEAARVLSGVHHPGFDFVQAAELRNPLPMLEPHVAPMEDEEEVEIGSAVLMGVRVQIAQDIDSEEITPDPLDMPTEAMVDAWSGEVDAALGPQDRCTVLTPLPWRDAVAQSIAMAAESHILIQQQFSVPTVTRMALAECEDGVEITGFDEHGGVLGAYRLPADISFWVMPEVVMQLQDQGIEIDPVAPPGTGWDLASMPSPGKLFN